MKTKYLFIVPFIICANIFAQDISKYNIPQSEVLEINQRLSLLTEDELNERKSFIENKISNLEEEQSQTQNPSRNKEISQTLNSFLAEIEIINQILLLMIPVAVIDAITDDITPNPDITAPKITIIGNNPAIVELGAAYSDAGATADGGEEVSVTSTVNTFIVGTYTVTYSATDASGNTGTVTRTVNVVDTTAPAVTPNGADATIELGGTYTEAGATATDASGTVNVVVGGDTVDTSAVGTYTVTYSATDASSNTGTASITITVVDTTAPAVTPNGADATIELGGTYTEAGATATDASGTVNVVVGGDTVDTNTVGTYTVTYSATDASSNTGTASITITVVDTTAPAVTPNGADATIELGGTYTEAGATATDASGTVNVVVGGDTVDTNTVGTYTVTYSATDASSNTGTASITITVVDTTAPAVTPNGADATIELGGTYTEAGATATDASGTVNVVVGGDTVDTNTVGTYTVTYSATDASSNTGTASITITVVDTTAPAVTPNGADATIELGGTYTEAGATATDASGTVNVVVGGDTVDTNTVGTYTVTYSATDASSNTGTASITITVVDTTAPAVTPNGADATIELGGTYTEAGATATDASGTVNVVVGGDTVDTNTVGTYTVTYSATDASSNTGTASITITVVDTTAPAVTPNGADATIELGGTYTEAGATATDASGTVNVVVGGDTVDTNTVGTYTVTYSATDASSNTGTASITITVVDTTAPAVTPNGADATIELGGTYTEAGATATDASGTVNVVVGGDTVDTNTVGTYTVTYSATDASSNTGTASITITVVDTTAPAVTPNGADATIELGGTYTEAGATATDASGTVNVVVGGDTVDTNTVGTYTVTYSATDASSNTGTASITITVVDTTAPAVTPNGADATIELGGTYTEAGATATDASGTVNVVVGGDTVDTNTVGTYTVTYSATDASSNTGTASITITVVDTTAPAVTPNGADATIELGGTYTEAGATATDASGTVNVVVGGDTVDTICSWNLHSYLLSNRCFK
jgi:proteasome assembly chaperone (PAC2) family protein